MCLKGKKKGLSRVKSGLNPKYRNFTSPLNPTLQTYLLTSLGGYGASSL